MLQKLIESFDPVVYKKLRRNDQIYRDGSDFILEELRRLVSAYGIESRAMAKRLIRDTIDHYLRRWHAFNIEDRIGGHYRETGLANKGITEHVIPAKDARDMLLAGALTFEQALNVPICKISVESDNLLRKTGLVSSTPNAWTFFERYKGLGISLEMSDGTPINQTTWTLEDHFNHFKHLVW